MGTGKVIAACLMLMAESFQLSPAVLLGIYQVERGQVGQAVGNTNGTYDLGPMQINTVWIPELAQYWGVSEATAKKWVRDDPCTNIEVAAWILKGHLAETGNLTDAIAQYHSRTDHIGSAYKKRVISAMHDHGLVGR